MDNRIAEQEIASFQMEQLELGQERVEAEREAMSEQDDPEDVVFELRGDLMTGERLATIALI